MLWMRNIAALAVAFLAFNLGHKSKYQNQKSSPI